MNKDIENVKQAKQSFDRILGNQKYASIIRDDKHLAIILDLVRGGNYRRILDIGTGTGYLAFPLAEEFPKAEVCGIDIAETIMDKNNEMVKEKGFTNLVFKAFDGLRYPFEEESFELIVSRYAFHHFPNVTDSIQQMHKILAKGGKVLISDPMRKEEDKGRVIDDFMRVKKDGHIQFYSPRELEELFVCNGFKKEKQVITEMQFPFAQKGEYIEVYDKTTMEDRDLYNIVNENGIVWVKHIHVGNTIFVKQ
ncbi:MAG: class I SAM-dependent methyltransferase [Lachnospiraceae bacterium]|nr:class I SAM-dependent methyltransferase [Lachnospiraceae bacterium]